MRIPPFWQPALRNWGIGRKALLIVFVPAIAATIFAGIGLASAGSSAVAAQRTYRLVEVSEAASALANELQLERVAVAGVLARPTGTDAVGQLRTRVDKSRGAEGRFRQSLEQVDELPLGVSAVVERINAALRDLDLQRTRVGRGAARPALSAATFAYRILIADLVAYREAVAQSGLDPVLADRIRGAAALTRAKEAQSVQQVAVAQALALGQLTPALSQEVVAARAGSDDALTEFDALAKAEWRSLLARTLTGEAVLSAQRLEGAVSRTGPYQAVGIPGGVDEWTRVISGRIGLLRTVETRVDAEVTDDVRAARTDQIVNAAGQALGLIVGLVLALFVTIAVARSVVGPLRLLRQRALAVAYSDLPKLVNGMRNTASLDDARELAKAAIADANSFDIAGRDEVGEVAAAFREVHAAAMGSAVEEAAQRSLVSQMYVTIGRRVQRNVDLVLSGLDELEQNEENPELLGRYFQVDQHATRLRRFAHTLLIFAGGGLGVPHRDPQPLYSVLEAAVSEAGDYQRIRNSESTDAVLKATTISEVVHIVAELLDNATRFSPPVTQVSVTTSITADGGVEIQVSDRGIGLDSDTLYRLNLMLSASTAPATTSQMGLAAVARLAQRSGVSVQLAGHPGVGTVASVYIPPRLLDRRAGHGAAGVASRHPEAIAAPVVQPAVRPTQFSNPGSLPSPDSPPEWPLSGASATTELPALASAHTGGQLAGSSARGSGAAGLPSGVGTPADANDPVEDPPEFARTLAEPVYRELRRVSPWLSTSNPVHTEGGPGWSSVSDPTWRAARAAANPVTDGKTLGGLPKRRRGAHLITDLSASATSDAELLAARRPEIVHAEIAATMRGLAAARTTLHSVHTSREN